MKSISKTSAKVKFGTTDDCLSSYAGLIPLLNTIRGSQAFQQLVSQFTHLKKRKRGYSVADKILNMIAHAYIGARTLGDMGMLSNDAGLQKATGIQFMADNTAGEFMRQLKTKQDVLSEYLYSQALKCYTRLSIDEEIMDADSSLFFNDKECAEYSYKKEKAFNPMFFISQTLHQFVHAEFRNGNASPMSDIIPALRRIVTSLAHLSRFCFRGDSAFFQEEIITTIRSHKNGRYTITARQNASIIESFSTISEWLSLDENDKTEIGETVGMIGKTAIRLVVKRTPMKKTDAEQTELFNDGRWKYYAVATDFTEEEKSAKEVIEFHNDRGNAENFFKELKNDYELSHFPFEDIDTNGAYFFLRLIAYNFLRMIMNDGLLFPSTWKKHCLKTVIFRFIHSAAKVVSHAHTVIVKIYKRHPYRDIFREALELSILSTF